MILLRLGTILLIAIASACLTLQAYDAEAQLEVRKTRATSDVVLYQMLVDFIYGNLALVVITLYSALLLTWYLYRSHRLPRRLKNAIDFIFSFEVSRRLAFVLISLLISLYVIASSAGIENEESFADYAENVKGDLQDFDDTAWNINELINFSRIKILLLSLSLKIFGNVRIIPFLASIAIVIVVYFITREISGKRFAGIVAVLLLIQSSTFRAYDDSAAYANFYLLLYLVSIYSLMKIWYMSPLTYILAVLAKVITAVFVPFSLFFAYRSSATIKNFRLVMITYGALLFFMIVIVLAGVIEGVKPELDSATLSKISYGVPKDWQLDDPFVFLALPPVIAGLFILGRKGLRQADALMFILAGMLWISFLVPVLTGISDQMYRHIPLIAFLAIGTGLMFSKTSKFVKRDSIYVHLIILAFSLSTVLMNIYPLIR